MNSRERFLLTILLLVTLQPGCVMLRGQRYIHFTARTPLEKDHTLVLGFLGGWESWNDSERAVRKLALKLRSMNLPGVQIETLENRKRRLAIELIRNALDRDRDGHLSDEERASVRLILYGHSFGGAAVAKLSRQLKKMNVPVLLTIQIDSVGRGDGLVPSNVRRAANMYQSNGLIIRGEKYIRPEDPDKTTIIGNFKFDYRNRKVDMSDASWFKKLFQSAHTKMEYDHEVWAKVEEMILSEIEVSTGKSVAAPA